MGDLSLVDPLPLFPHRHPTTAVDPLGRRLRSHVGWMGRSSTGLSRAARRSRRQEVAAQASSYYGCPRLATDMLIPDSPRWMGRPMTTKASAASDQASPSAAMARESYMDRHALAGWGSEFWSAWDPFWSTWEHLSRPFRAMFTTGIGVTDSRVPAPLRNVGSSRMGVLRCGGDSGVRL